MDEVRNIPTEHLVEPWAILRPVAKGSIEYMEMMDSLAETGFWNSISVRPSPRHPGKYEVIDGNYRFHCARDLGLPLIPCIVKEGVTDEDILAAQIRANAVRPETTPVEFARQLKRIQKTRPGITLAQMSKLVHKQPRWISQQLDLLRLSQPLQLAVDRGEIPLASAYMLAKIPPGMQAEYVDAAKSMPTAEFQALAAGVIKQYRECVHRGKLEQRFLLPFAPQPYLRPLKEVQNEVKQRIVGPLLIASEDCRTPLDGFYLALEWLMHLDKRSIDEQRRAAETRNRLAIEEQLSVS